MNSDARRVDVTTWGVAGSVVGLGVEGRASLGASRGGAVDVEALRLANRLVGNPDGAFGIETSGGLELVLRSPATVAATGALADIVVHNGPPLGWGSPVSLPAGAIVRVARLVDGARTYVAVRGGLHEGDGSLDIGSEPSAPPSAHAAVPRARSTSVRLWPGPRLDRFVTSAWATLTSSTLVVTSTSRVGVRLAGVHLERTTTDELSSEGMVEGAVQVPPDGNPIVMLADHPTTGGYPVVGVVDPRDLGALAQAAPGSTVEFSDATRRRTT